MKFNLCIPGKCTDQGTHCEGCGRSHEEIAETKKMVMNLVSFAQKQGYEKYKDFADFIGKSILSKLQNPSK
ncbi:MAG: DUF1289 domain-containing protein [Gammaproteobacteria bacterium]